MATPHPKIVKPARAWVYFSKKEKESLESPNDARSTTDNMVTMVVRPKTAVTKNVPLKLAVAAGYINIGISGSQGPSTKIVNKIQGVMLGWSCASATGTGS